MPYCTLNDIKDHLPEERIIQLTDDEGTGSVTQARVDKAIEAADELIDGYLRGRYPLPLDTVPGLINKLSIDIAIYNLYQRKMRLEIPEELGRQYKNALKLLEQIQKGLVSLGIESGSTEAGEFRTNKTSDDRTFSKDVMDKF